MGQLLISAAHKSSGKTTVTTGICAALRARNKRVQPFKKGPDYIDPMWLSTAAQRNCYNLDFWTQSNDEIKQLFAYHSSNADFTIIEANKGLHDGLDLDGSNSNAALAKLLGSPVILVLDCRGTIRGVAPLLIGYQQFDRAVDIKGVILNFVGGNRHEKKLRSVIEHYTDIKVVGAIQRNPELVLEERYLGLMPSNEDREAVNKIESIANLIANQVDLESLVELASPCPTVEATHAAYTSDFDLTIAYAKDEAFGFYYADDLETFAALGAKLVPFNTLEDTQLPAADALLIGGGFPEKRLQQLEQNSTLRRNIFDALNNGMPAYAECGGLMYLSNAIHYQGRAANMVGFIDADCKMTDKPQGRGYIQFIENQHSLWPEASGQTINAHEFHYSYLDGLGADHLYTFDVTRGQGMYQQQDGLRLKNTLACYAHQRHTRQNPWIDRFLKFVKKHSFDTAK